MIENQNYLLQWYITSFSSRKSKVLDGILAITPRKGSVSASSISSMIEDLKFSESLAHCEYLRDRGFVKLLDVSDRDGSDYIVSRTPGGDVFFQDGGCRKESAHEAIKGAFGIAKVLLALISGIILIYIPWQALQYQRKQDQREEARRDFENRLEGRDSTIDVLNVQIDQLKDSLAYLKIQRLIVDAKTQTNATKRIE